MTVIVQLSDTHLIAGGAPAYGRVDTYAAMQRAAAHLAGLGRAVGGIDALVITGDLTDHGEPEAYALLAEALKDLPFPIHALPGNHDLREPMRAAFPAKPATGPLDEAIQVGPLRLVLLDDLVEGEPWGRLSAAQLEWLDTTLAAHAPHPTLVFLHHPPFATGIAFMDAIGLREPEALETVIRRHPHVHLVGCGHIHRTIITHWAGVPCVVAPGPAHAVALDVADNAVPGFAMEPGAVLVHRWDGTRLVTQVSFVDPWGGAQPFGS